MLTLTRKPGQTITIIVPPCDTERTIVVRTIEITHTRAVLGVHAERDILILRSELERLDGAGTLSD